MFGLGGQEILLLAILGAVPLAVVVIVLLSQKKSKMSDEE